jgi:transposase-like protein
MQYYCKKCQRWHNEETKIGLKHKKFKKRVSNKSITAYRKRMGTYDEGGTLKEHYEIDKDRQGDWG